jgi:periplasmic protein CpxP/Spy
MASMLASVAQRSAQPHQETDMSNTDANIPNSSPAPQAPLAPQKPKFYKRGWFIASAVIVTGLVGFGAGKASNRGWGHHYSMHRMGDAGQSMPGSGYMLNRVLGRVDATAEQKDKIAEIARMTFRELAPMRQQHMATRDKLAALMKAETLDRAAVEQLRAQELTLAETLSKRASQALLDAADVLTPAQRTKLVERWQNRRGGWYNRG